MPSFFGSRRCCCDQETCVLPQLENFGFTVGNSSSIDNFIEISDGDILSPDSAQTIDPDWETANSAQKNGSPYYRLLTSIYAETVGDFPLLTSRQISVAWFPEPFVLENRKIVIRVKKVRQLENSFFYLYLRQGGKLYLGGALNVSLTAEFESIDSDYCDFQGSIEYLFSPLQNVESIDPDTGLPSTSTKRINPFEDLEIGIGVYSELYLTPGSPNFSYTENSYVHFSDLCYEWGNTVTIPCGNYVCCFDDSEISTEMVDVTWPSGSFGYPVTSGGAPAKNAGLAFFQSYLESVVIRPSLFLGEPYCECSWTMFQSETFKVGGIVTDTFQLRISASRNTSITGVRYVSYDATLDWITSTQHGWIQSRYRVVNSDQSECNGDANLTWWNSRETSGSPWMGWFDFRNNGETVNVSW